MLFYLELRSALLPESPAPLLPPATRPSVYRRASTTDSSPTIPMISISPLPLRLSSFLLPALATMEPLLSLTNYQVNSLRYRLIKN